MVLIFWQGIISIHQKTFLEALAVQPTVTRVLMVVEQEISAYRKNMGWEVPEIANVEIVVAPTREQIAGIFDRWKDAVHVLGGIRVGPMMTMAFEEGAKRKAKMGSLSEPYDRSGWKGKLRDMKYRYLKLRYFKHIDFFLAVGREGVKTYTGLGFDAERVYPWAYFVSVALPAVTERTGTEKTKKIIYAGRLEEGKGIARFVSELSAVKGALYQLDIYGGGPDEERLKFFVADRKLGANIKFFPFLKYDELVKQYVHYDWVVLPSTKKDGWGVIVSEGLLNGLKAICSNICGVSWAIQNNVNGAVFDWSEEGSCAGAIDTVLNSNVFAGRADIKTWAEGALSSNAGARYYLQIIESTYNGAPKPKAPWL